MSFDSRCCRVELVDILDPGQMSIHHSTSFDSHKPVIQDSPLCYREIHLFITHHCCAGKCLCEIVELVEFLLRTECTVGLRLSAHGQHNEFGTDRYRDDTLHWRCLAVRGEQLAAL